MISVIVPGYNEEKSIKACLESILPQLSLDDEIICVMSGCTDHTYEIIMSIPDNRVKLLIQKEREGKASAINLAMKHAKGDIIVQTDADVELAHGAIAALFLSLLLNPKVVAVSGHPVPLLPKDNIFFDWTMMSYRKMDEIRTKEASQNIFWHLCGYLMAFKKEVFEPLPFAKGAVDAWAGIALRKKGMITYAPGAIVYVKAPLTVKDFIAQKARVRAGFAALSEKPRSIWSELLSFPIELFKVPPWRWHKFCFSACVYAYCWAKGFYMKKTNKSLKEIWKIPESTK